MGPGLVVVVAAGVLAALVAAGLVLRGERDRRRRLDEELSRAHQQVDQLGQRLDQVAAELDETRRAGERSGDREYVITTLGEVEQGEAEGVPVGASRATSPDRLVEQRLLAALARRPADPVLGRRVVAVAVKVVAASHGVRRALRPEVRDRAAAEAYVARRQSRRARREELREARRLLRVVRSRQATARAGEDAA